MATYSQRRVLKELNEELVGHTFETEIFRRRKVRIIAEGHCTVEGLSPVTYKVYHRNVPEPKRAMTLLEANTLASQMLKPGYQPAASAN